MPTCADFGVIDEYLNLRDQMEITETYDLLDLDQKVPQNDYSTLTDQKCVIKVEASTDGPGMDPYLEDYTRQYSLFPTNPYTSCTPLTSSSPQLVLSHVSEPMLGTSSLTTLTSLNSGNSNSSSSASDTSTSTFVAKIAGSGCTVIRSDQSLPRNESTDLFDLHPSMCEDDLKLYIKAEPQEEGQLPQTCHLGGNGVVIRGHGLHGNEDTAMNCVLDQLIRNDVQVQEDCKILGISPDPTQWSNEDVQCWVRWICRKYNYKDDCWHLFNVSGSTLCQMGEGDFKWRAPEAANCLFHQLEACRLAYRFAPVNSYPSPPYGGSDLPYLPTSHLQGQPDPSVSPSPSVSSTCSTTSCSSGSNGYHHVDTNDDDVFSLTRNDTRRQSAAAQLSYPPATGNRAHSHPASQRQPKQTIHLWQFLKELLEDPDNYHGCIKWTDRSRGIFKIEDSSKVARLWGRRKNRPAMNYDKLSRSVRQYYKKGIIKKTEHSKRLVYQFCPPYL